MTIQEAVEAAEKIEGWMNRAELTWLADKAEGRDTVVEFGSHLGRSTVALTTAYLVLAVDIWEDPSIAESFYGNTKHLPVNAFRMRSRKAMFDLLSPPRKADMVFIDADHRYDSVYEDIRIAYGLLCGKGLICGHDFSNDYPGVKQAVSELVPDFKRVPGGDIWYKEL